jgi:hypothetical protein
VVPAVPARLPRAAMQLIGWGRADAVATARRCLACDATPVVDAAQRCVRGVYDLENLALVQHPCQISTTALRLREVRIPRPIHSLCGVLLLSAAISCKAGDSGRGISSDAGGTQTRELDAAVAPNQAAAPNQEHDASVEPDAGVSDK